MIHFVQSVHLFINHRENGIDTKLISVSNLWKEEWCFSHPQQVSLFNHSYSNCLDSVNKHNVSIQDGRFTVQTGAEISL